MSDPWREGFDARLRGEAVRCNPYKLRNQEWLLWEAGWRDQDEHLRDRDKALESIGWFKSGRRE